jgi:putative oxygen-independent coproporphyrinogen III oxidase
MSETRDMAQEPNRAAGGVYVHIPFCLTRCGYCDFNAYAGLDEMKPRYLFALMAEADLVSEEWSDVDVTSVFLGGGTPTTMGPGQLSMLVEHLRGVLGVGGDAELTVEANPDTVDEGSLAALLEIGVDRLSIGAQSFDRRVLAALERVHQPEAVLAAFDAAVRVGFTNINLDLIYGADGETLDSWRSTLEETVLLAPEHVSAYALTIEPSTSLGRAVAAGTTPAPDPDLQADMFGEACVVLGEAGYHHYEVSNWAKPGYECRHNLGYWERRPYLGLGAGAHSYRDDRRWWNTRPPQDYMARVERGEVPVGGEERLEPSDAYLEEVFLRLRTFEGIPASWVDPEVVARFRQIGLLQDRIDTLVPTERGMLLLNELVLAFTAA